MRRGKEASLHIRHVWLRYIFPLQRYLFNVPPLHFSYYSLQVSAVFQFRCVTFPTFWDAPCREDSKEAEDQISLAPDEGPRMPYQLLGSLEVPRISVTGIFLKVGRRKRCLVFPLWKTLSLHDIATFFKNHERYGHSWKLYLSWKTAGLGVSLCPVRHGGGLPGQGLVETR